MRSSGVKSACLGFCVDRDRDPQRLHHFIIIAPKKKETARAFEMGRDAPRTSLLIGGLPDLEIVDHRSKRIESAFHQLCTVRRPVRPRWNSN